MLTELDRGRRRLRRDRPHRRAAPTPPTRRSHRGHARPRGAAALQGRHPRLPRHGRTSSPSDPRLPRPPTSPWRSTAAGWRPTCASPPGLVEPHLFAGFSGGPKLVAIGTAGLETVMALHNGRRVGDPKATWGVVEGNPVHDAIRAVAALAPASLLPGSGARLGEAPHSRVRRPHPRRAPRRRPRSPAQTTMARVDRPLSPGDHLVRRRIRSTRTSIRPSRGSPRRPTSSPTGGTIILAAECAVRSAQLRHVHRRAAPRRGHPRGERPHPASRTTVVPDQWQVQVQARIQARARVLVKSSGLSDRRHGHAPGWRRWRTSRRSSRRPARPTRGCPSRCCRTARTACRSWRSGAAGRRGRGARRAAAGRASAAAAPAPGATPRIPPRR